METIAFSIGNGLCWGASLFLDSPACHTRAHEISVGYLFFVVVSFLVAWTLTKRLNNA